MLSDELEKELLLRERLALKTLAIDFTLGLDQGTGAEAEWMENYKFQGISSLNAFQKDRAIEQIASYHEKFTQFLKMRGIDGSWAKDLNAWIQSEGASMESPLIGRAMIGRIGGALEKFSRYLEPIVHNGVPYWFWAEKIPGESIYDGWLIMDGRQENFPPPTTREFPWHDQVSMPAKASHLLAAAIVLEKELDCRLLPAAEFSRPLIQGATALAAPKLGKLEDRKMVSLRDFFILQLPGFNLERLGKEIS